MHSLRNLILDIPKRNRQLLFALVEKNVIFLSQRISRGYANDKSASFSKSELEDQTSLKNDTDYQHSSLSDNDGTNSREKFSNKSRNFRTPFFHRNSERNKYASDHKNFDRNRFDKYGDNNERFFQKRDSGEIGLNIKEKEWDVQKLAPLEKNFYVEASHQFSEDDVEKFYKSNNISVKRGSKPKPIIDFHDANFPDEINKQLQKNGWTTPTPIQSIGWPLALSGKNMVGIAQTGSGKTLGYILPALVHIKHQRQSCKGEGPIVLVLAPTRELAQQIKSVSHIYGRLLGAQTCCLFGGQSKLVQSRQLTDDPEIVVATPGRLLDFIESGAINLERTSYVILDEADRMLDMGFEPQIRKVLGQIRPDKQILMWSATWPEEIRQLAHDFLGDFVQVNIGSAELMANPNIEQIIKVCNFSEKFKILAEEIKKATSNEDNPKILIFVQTKTQADLVTDRLRKQRFSALAIHGDKSQLVRDTTLTKFRKGECSILVATDVASRGLDVNDISLVVNYDYPNTADDYIHRIGRTARASKTGKAITLITEADANKVEDLMKVLIEAGQSIPNELANLAYGKMQSKSRGPTKFSPYKSGFNRQNSWHRFQHFE